MSGSETEKNCHSPRTIHKKLLFPLVGVIAVLLFCFSGVIFWQHNRLLSSISSSDVSWVVSSFYGSIDQQASGLAISVEILADEKDIVNALERGDRDHLLKACRGTFEKLKEERDITHFYFHDSRRINLLRVHKPEKSGDIINRYTAIKAERTHRISSGIELGPLGTFTLRCVKPVLDGDKVIGYIELGKEIEGILESVHSEAGLELAVAIDKYVVDRNNWESGMHMLGRESDWGLYADDVLIYSSLPGMTKGCRDELSPMIEQRIRSHRKLSYDDAVWEVTSLPLADVSGSDVGNLIIIRDISMQQSSFYKTIAAIIFLMFVLAVILIFFFNVILNSVDNKIIENEQVLLQSQNRYRELFDSSQDALVILSSYDYQFVSANKSAYELFNLTGPGDLCSKNPMDLSPEYQPDGRDSKEKAIEKINECVRFGSCSFEWQHMTSDGAEFPATVTLTSINVDGELLVQGTVRDITAQKQAERRLESMVEQMEAIFDSSLVGIMVLRNRILTKVNQRMADMLGYRPEEMVGKGPQQLHLSEKNFYEFGEKYYWRLAEREVVRAEYPLRHKDGSTVWCQFNGKAMAPPDLSKGAVWIIEDITERRKEQEELKKLKDHLERVLKTAATAVYTVDANKHITTVNRELCTLSGYSKDELVGKSCSIFCASNCDGCPLNDMGGSDVLMQVESVIYGKNGKRLDILRNMEVVRNEQGEVLYGINSFVDVTELVAARKKAEMANRTKSDFLANMSHEIRTPMNAIIGFSDMLIEEEMEDNQKGFVETIRRSADTLLNLINDILDFSKIESGKLAIEMVECRLGETLTTLEGMLSPMADNKGLEFKVNRSSELPAVIRTDPTRLNQCLVNLVNNAIKFTDEGHVYVNVSLLDRDGEEFLQFDVEDTGIGIPVGKQQMIFDSFSQADSSTTRKYGGTGLGLAITKSLAGLLGGELSLSSEDGEGSVFTLTIKADVISGEEAEDEGAAESGRADGQCDGKSKGDESGQNGGGNKYSGKVLVAEDVVTNQKLIKLVLEKMGFEVDIAENGKVALDKALAESYDIIFMDMQMPEMNGYEATVKIRENNINTPVIALTANAMKGDAEKCIEAGCDDYMPKPIDRNKIIKLLDHYLSKSARSKSGAETNGGRGRFAEGDGADDGGEGVFDYQQFVDRSGGAREIMDAIIEAWKNESPVKLKNLFAAVEGEDAGVVAYEAHSLKSMASNIGGVGLSEDVLELELAAKNGESGRFKELLRKVEQSYQVLEEKLVDRFGISKA